MIKQLFSWMLLTTSIWVVDGFRPPQQLTVTAQPELSEQSEQSGELFYFYFDQQIPLRSRQDAIAVESESSKERGSSDSPFYWRLQQHLQANQIRGQSDNIGDIDVTPMSETYVDVTPLGETYALVTLRTDAAATLTEIQQEIRQFPDTKRILPVLTRQNYDEILVLPDEILVSFEPTLSPSQIQTILSQQNLEVIHQLQFAESLYLVRPRFVSGSQVLQVANQLNQLSDIEYATPHFIQSISQEIPPSTWEYRTRFETLDAAQLMASPTDLSMVQQSIARSGLIPLEWHLHSQPLSQCLEQITFESDSLLGDLVQCSAEHSRREVNGSTPRTDIRAQEAWQESNHSREVVVAVIDSLIQWDHPDLQDTLHVVDSPDQCPGEVHGWDFSGVGTTDLNNSQTCPGDPDTRISQDEIKQLQPIFQDIMKVLQLSDQELLQELFKDIPEELKGIIFCPPGQPDCSEQEIVQRFRIILALGLSSEFHGTMTAGLIAAQSFQEQGLSGVAPNVKLLPVRVAGLGGESTTVSLLHAIRYATDRGAEIINLSLGRLFPSPAIALEIDRALREHPNLIIVASAGNDGMPTVAFPAGLPGVVAVGAITLEGNRAPYSNFGGFDIPGIPSLDVVAPGGNLWTPPLVGGILTTGGTWVDDLWRGIDLPTQRWGTTLDYRGGYLWVQGTSFSAPIVSGTFALMKGEDTEHLLSREQLISILNATASYDGLTVSEEEQQFYEELRRQGELPASLSVEQFFFGGGLVNAEAALREVK
ncbi:S8 family peptidase [Leptolyngbya sp. Heron Island J]|uniref:S8 family peptidase n=1 Tax=Leptolyngbya sp. Heron Island J TaxID=1385935 RepID=UPI00041A169D|nr:S8 family serine peptidase [Leptolyngbya sp. Heron Island J]